MRDALPPECLAASHPVALLSKVYDPSHPDCQDDPNFFGDLEVHISCSVLSSFICILITSFLSEPTFCNHAFIIFYSLAI